MANLEAKANEILGTGDYSLIYALKSGLGGIPNQRPSSGTIEAYRTGLNLYFRHLGIGDLVSAEQITQPDNATLQEGFFKAFDTFRIKGTGHSYAEFFWSKYQRTLDQYANLHKLGIIEERAYMDFIQGSLIALDVWEARLGVWKEGLFRIETNYEKEVQEWVKRKISSLNGLIDEIHNLRVDLWNRRENPTEYVALEGFTPKEIGKLEFLLY